MEPYFRYFLICAVFTLVSSLTLPHLVTKPSRHTKYTANATPEGNGKLASATKGVVLYKVTQSDGATCILLEADGLIEVYFKSNNSEEIVDTYMLDGAQIEGDCKYEDIASMRITWKGYTLIWDFAKTPVGEQWYVSQVELTVDTELEAYHSIRSHVLPSKNFTLTHTQLLFPTPVGKSYASSETTIDLSFPEGEHNPASLSGRLFLRSFQLQPFMGTLGAGSTLVSSRHTTSEGNETKLASVAATTATKGVILYKVTQSNGATCILLEADGLIEVYFKSNNNEEIVDTYMLDGAQIEGNCKYEDIASMRITWKGYTLIWNFAKTPGGKQWYVSQVEVTVDTGLKGYDSIRSLVPSKNFTLTHTQILFPTPVGKSYASSETIIDLSFPEGEDNPANLSGRLFLRSFQLQPFMCTKCAT